ncbi:MAG: response regulator [Anaerolineae bacterium]|nr:response regulator [Anaerolineae bacterium]MDQ7034742.1 response regulator [Anaerolineae bacterium]
MYKILVVDDEAYIRMLMEDTLESLEHPQIEILSAENGQEALEIIQAQCPQIVFLDVMMPRMNGFTVCQTVKRDWQMTDVYICMVSAKSQGYDVQHGVDVGADKYLVKPFKLDEMLDLVRNVLNLEIPSKRG